MKLEEAIKQTTFRSEHHKMVLNLIYTAGVINAEQTRFFKNYDISPQQYNVLRILKGQYPNAASVGLVQERMLDQMSNASRLVEKLKLKKLLTRRECKVDRRQVDLVITEAGLELLKAIEMEFNPFEQKLAELSSEKAKILNDILDELTGNL